MEDALTEFRFIESSVDAVVGEGAEKVGALGGCSCTGDPSHCLEAAELCFCIADKGRTTPSYDADGRLQSSRPIFECNALCECPRSCPNRVAQRGVTAQLELFHESDKGYGVRARQRIGRATFVAEYAGELCSEQEARRRNARNQTKTHQYLLSVCEHFPPGVLHELNAAFSPTEKVELRTHIDARDFGNIARFINHSCAPNLESRVFRIDHVLPARLALFAARDIEAGEELSFSYGALTENRTSKPCLCGAPNCLGEMPFDARF